MTMRKYLVAIACMLLCVSAGAKAPKWLKSVKNSVFEVVAFDADGNETGRSHGFFIDRNGTGIADRSVFSGAARAVTIDAAGIERPVNLILGANDMYDVIRFSVTTDKKLCAADMSPVQCFEGNSVSVLGNKGEILTAADIEKCMNIADNRFYYNLALAFDSTYTGCPVMDESGMVIGIIQAGKVGDKTTYALDARFVADIEVQALSLEERAYSDIKIRKSFPKDVNQALAYIFIKQSTASTKEYGTLLEDFILQFPDNADGMFNLGSYLILETDSTQYSRGLELIEKSIVASDEKDRMHCDYANLIYNTVVQGQRTFDFWTLDKALDEVNTAISIKEVPTYFQLQGNILYAMKRYSDAYESFVRLNGTSLASSETYMSAYMVRRQLDNDPTICVELLDSALSKLPKPMPTSAATLLLERATLKEAAGRNREAVLDYNTYEELVGAYSMSAKFYYLREQVEIKAKMYEQALADINRARQLAPDDSDLVLENASLLLRIGNYKTALPLLTDLEKQYQESADIQRLLGICYMRLEQKDNARKHLTIAKELGDTVAAQLLEE